jgi:hypothetical protein
MKTFNYDEYRDESLKVSQANWAVHTCKNNIRSLEIKLQKLIKFLFKIIY